MMATIIFDDQALADRAGDFIEAMIDAGLGMVAQMQVIELVMVMQALRARDPSLTDRMLDGLHKHARQLARQHYMERRQ